jgi:hypothetical protein
MSPLGYHDDYVRAALSQLPSEGGEVERIEKSRYLERAPFDGLGPFDGSLTNLSE